MQISILGPRWVKYGFQVIDTFDVSEDTPCADLWIRRSYDRTRLDVECPEALCRPLDPEELRHLQGKGKLDSCPVQTSGSGGVTTASHRVLVPLVRPVQTSGSGGVTTSKASLSPSCIYPVQTSGSGGVTTVGVGDLATWLRPVQTSGSGGVTTQAVLRIEDQDHPVQTSGSGGVTTY